MTRRHFGRVGALGAAGLMLGSAGTASAQSRAELRSEFLLDLVLDAGTSRDLGRRRIVAVTGGTFDGPKLRGVVLDGGADWIIRRPDSTSQLDVRTTLQTDDDQLLYLSYRGIIHRPDGSDESYWRTTPVFETASEKYSWLTRIIAVGVARSVPGKVAYSVYQIL